MRVEPLVPDPGDARDWLRTELLHREYRPDLVERVRRWFDDLLDQARGTPIAPSGWLLLVLLVVVAVGVAVVLSRLRRDVGTTAPAPVFDDVRRPAGEHRRLARAAYDAGRWDAAVVEGMRAISAGLVERGVVPDAPASTAHEVTALAAPRFPAYAERLEEAARAFDETRYGDRRASRERATRVLDLERELAGASPSVSGRSPVTAVPR